MNASKALLKGVYHCEIRTVDGAVRDTFSVGNLVPATGLNHMLSSTLGETSQITSWYMGLLGNITPADGTTMATVAANEVTAYDEYSTSRPDYTPDGASTAKKITNAASPAVFTCSTDSTSVYGMFLASSTSGSTGVLLSAATFSTTKTLDDGETLTVTYELTAADDGA